MSRNAAVSLGNRAANFVNRSMGGNDAKRRGDGERRSTAIATI
jgi:hypothetical protein